MKLWVDDIRTPPDDSWHIARNAWAAIRALDMFYKDMTEINLDHDISHQVVVGKMSRPYPCDETFEIVARYIARLKEIDTCLVAGGYADKPWNPKIQIHTSNHTGAANMKKILEDVGLEPTATIIPGANRLENML